jgi:hypothetical protein
MGEVAWASIQTKASYFHAQFSRIARRRGREKAAVAVAHRLLNRDVSHPEDRQPTLGPLPRPVSGEPSSVRIAAAT